ncbi:MAG: hypothetical protein JXQ66_06010 [Campylobacterales bacterium]|nr:hypothetical protein [Campylobacterales bacterium]
MYLKIVCLVLCSCVLYADDKVETENSSYIDSFHKLTSESVSNFSSYLDDSLSNMFESKASYDENCSELQKEFSEIDRFNQNEKFIDDTDRSFVKVRFSSKAQTIGDIENEIKLKAYVDLRKSKKNLKLFIESSSDDAIEQFNDSYSDNDSKTRIGISYLSPEYYSIKSRYSIAFRGLDPYLKVRFKRAFELERWIIEPNQSFKYNIYDDVFEENTYIYFDTKLDNERFFRILLSRGTTSEKNGMDYGAALTYIYKPQKEISIGMSQSFSGNSEYSYTDANNNIINYSGINSYTTQLSWRHNVWKKWFNYEIIPAVSFQKENDFKANYQITILTDFYFGNF